MSPGKRSRFRLKGMASLLLSFRCRALSECAQVLDAHWEQGESRRQISGTPEKSMPGRTLVFERRHYITCRLERSAGVSNASNDLDDGDRGENANVIGAELSSAVAVVEQIAPLSARSEATKSIIQ